MSNEDVEKVDDIESSSEPVDLLGFGVGTTSETPPETPSVTSNQTEVDLLGFGTPSNSESDTAKENPEHEAAATPNLLDFDTNATENVPLNNGLDSFQETSNDDKHTNVQKKEAEMIFEASTMENGIEKQPLQEEAKDHADEQQNSLQSKEETPLIDSMSKSASPEKPNMLEDHAPIDLNNSVNISENNKTEDSDEIPSQDGKDSSVNSTTTIDFEEKKSIQQTNGTTSGPTTFGKNSEKIKNAKVICREDETETSAIVNAQDCSRDDNNAEKEAESIDETPVKVKEIVDYYEEFATQTKRTSIGPIGPEAEELPKQAMLEKDTVAKDEPSNNTDVSNITAPSLLPLNNEKLPAENEQNEQPKTVQEDTPAARIGELPPADSQDLAKNDQPHDSVQNTRPKVVERDLSTATIVELPPPEQESSTEPTTEEGESLPLETQALIMDLQGAVQEHLNGREAALERAIKAESRVEYLEGVLESKKAVENELADVKTLLESTKSDREHLLVELEKLRENRDEHERKQIVLSNRLNAAKKQEAFKTNHAEKLEDEIQVLDHKLVETQNKLEMIERSNKQSSEESKTMKTEYEGRIRKLESNLKEERRLNDERKKKMKVFVENKQEELRNSQAQNDELNMELSQTNRSLREHHSRWKQLHAQWVQSQTRNRELQRDINRMKKESESMSRLGDKMNQKLSQSAQETEEHKNKRLNAKQELMTLLNTLESEREVSSKLRDSIKFTFTPKALSQQQILKESLRDFEDGLVRLSQRLGKPLAPRNDVPEESINNSLEDDDESDPTRRTRSEIDSTHLLTNLEGETQRVSQCIMAMSSNIERLHMLVSQSGEKSCASVLSDLLAGATGATEETTSMTRPRMTIGTSQNYGQVPTVNH
eukprot:CAMPEP_0194229828 /NCGR_PEP_ID=MMETSP0156-20130528/44091_1 /TAXON_ID=33649 /ORGANISM="Thalassionema nitzschioides, Strain L26-B" /LENGTH=884 /DNA_ID=CAMNT_0038962389 /DNA_START=21 /DNA_END=2675 /DNA_ORIENTATION=-